MSLRIALRRLYGVVRLACQGSIVERILEMLVPPTPPSKPAVLSSYTSILGDI